ncbi:MAG: Gfo/Idh/MocA family oxidoreductase [Sphingobium sp.]
MSTLPSTSLEDVLADEEIEAVVLATPHDVHVPQIPAAVSAGKHVFVEKPLALQLTQAHKAVTAAVSAGKVLAVGLNRRFLPAAAALRDAVERGDLGDLVHLEGLFCNDTGLSYDAGMWRAQESGPLSAMTAMGIHVLDFLMMLCGPVQTVRTNSVRRLASVAVDDVVCVNIMFQNGVPAELTTMLTTPRQWRIRVYGSRGWAELSDEHTLHVSDGRGPVKTTVFDAIDTLRVELEAFAAATRGNGNFPVSTKSALDGVAAFEAIITSASAGGAPIDVTTTAAD